MRRWLIAGLLVFSSFHAVPEQAYQAKDNQGDTKQSVNTPAAGNKGPPVPRPSSQKEQKGPDDETNHSDWCKYLLAPVFDNWANLAITAWGILILINQTKATRKAAEAARDSVLLQQTGMQQWIDIKEWKAWFTSDAKTSLTIQFDIVNPTNFPLTIEAFEISFNLPGIITQHPLPTDFRLTPGNPQTVFVIFPITQREANAFRSAERLVIRITIASIHTDMGPNERTRMLAEGDLACQHGTPDREAMFVPIVKKAEKADRHR